MRKSIILLGSALLLATAGIAQDEVTTTESTAEVLKSKKGEVILPSKGDWSIGIDASPFLRYAGNMFSNNSSNIAPTWNGYTANSTNAGNNGGTRPSSIIGKYFKDEKTAYRAIVAIGKENVAMTKEITKAEAMPAANQYFGAALNKTTDRYTKNSNGIVLGGGLEKRRGAGRLQGFYGGEVLLAIQGGTKHKYEYGNALTQNAQQNQPNVNPSDANFSTDWGGNLVGSGAFIQHAGVRDGRVLSKSVGKSFGFGVRGFIGVEYFFMPKISIAGEFGAGLAYQKLGATSTKYEAEGYNADGSEAAATFTESVKSSRHFNLTEESKMNTGTALMNYLAPNGTLRLNFHF